MEVIPGKVSLLPQGWVASILRHIVLLGVGQTVLGRLQECWKLTKLNFPFLHDRCFNYLNFFNLEIM